MRVPAQVYPRIGIALLSMGVYALVFYVLYPSIGGIVAALCIFPLVVIGWLLGVYGGLVFGILSFPLNVFMSRLMGYPSTETISHFLTGSLIITLVGMGTGWIKGLLDRLHRQAEELREERKILHEEMEKRIRAEERLIHEALHDPLTNLPNRRLFMNRLEHAIEWNRRYPSDLFAVLYLDFDRFKIINDNMGHNVGDLLLIEMGRRLKHSIRTMDMVARMGGDEFAVLLEAVKGSDQVVTIVKRLQRSLAAPFEAEENTIHMTASIGVVMSLQRYERTDDVIRDADIAMYNAKVGGKNNFRVFDIGMREQAESVLKLESDLRSAFRNGEFQIQYQPIFSLKPHRLSGFEALIRWEHPERGVLYPADFMKAAEESGLIIPIGQWVLCEACRQTKQWQVQFGMDPPLTISVNISSRQFSQPDLIQQIDEILKATELPANSLSLELTEMTLIEDMEVAVIKIERLRKIGVGIDIDDFGTGYSSLGYLRHLPVDNLKLDRSFVSTLGVNRSAIPIIRAIIAMANSLGMNVIAEGIETENQVNSLIEMKCDYGQGFLFNKPIDHNAALELIKKDHRKYMRR
ncbi:MAG: EAL domain-containing protein [Anaerolineales bacterium]|nr:MAG: EAL domain-containing protein [Anaerolineales bacterium]